MIYTQRQLCAADVGVEDSGLRQEKWEKIRHQRETNTRGKKSVSLAVCVTTRGRRLEKDEGREREKGERKERRRKLGRRERKEGGGSPLCSIFSSLSSGQLPAFLRVSFL